MASVPSLSPFDSFADLHVDPPDPGHEMASWLERIRLVDGCVVYWREVPTMTTFQLDVLFAEFDRLTQEAAAIHWVWDVGETQPPAPSVLLHFQRRAEPFAARTRHLAVRTGANVGLWLALRYLLPEAGFTTISVHRTVATAVERAARG